MTITKRKYEEAEVERRAANAEITALWLEFVKPAQAWYESDPRTIRADSRRKYAERTIAAYQLAHPAEFPASDDDDIW